MSTEIVTTRLGPPDKTLEAALAMARRAETLTIRNAAEAIVAQEFALEFDRVIKQAKAILQPAVDIASRALDDHRAYRDLYLKPLMEGKARATAVCIEWNSSEKRRVEAERRIAEQKALDEALARQRADVDAAATKAVSLAKAGLQEDAEAAMEEAVEIEQAAPKPVHVAVEPVAKVRGMSFPEDWDFEVLDAAKVPAEYKVLDMAAIRSVIKRTKGRVEIPGIRAFPVPRGRLRTK